jgi:hypothetical protein
MTQVNARINKEIYDRLSEYSEISGVPIARCIAEACDLWLTTVAAARIDAIRRPVFGGGVRMLSGEPLEDAIAQGARR